MTREEWIKLAERCEAATGPDREIDEAIARALGWTQFMFGGAGRVWKDANGNIEPVAHRITGNLNIITALIEREFPGVDKVVNVINGFRRGPRVGVTLFAPNKLGSQSGGGATEALSHCAAFCRAKAEVA